MEQFAAEESIASSALFPSIRTAVDNAVTVPKMYTIAPTGSAETFELPYERKSRVEIFEEQCKQIKEAQFTAMNDAQTVISIFHAIRMSLAALVKAEAMETSVIEVSTAGTQSRSSGMMLARYTGDGTETWADGTIYRGQFVDGLKHGHGKILYSTGDVFEGKFVRGKKHGLGVSNFVTGDSYDGEFREDRRHGQGTSIQVHDKTKETYIGSWYQGFKHGAGTLEYGNGDKFEGRFANGRRQGIGKMYKADGREIDGEWNNDYLIKETIRKHVSESGLQRQRSRTLLSVFVKQDTNSYDDFDDYHDDYRIYWGGGGGI